ncbi:synaptic vesicle glycoprotein 2B [Anastrepha obliqua]|uniref:synaptic vesicle glycoprotein 2B n=1 Tax=Anastrepha obliqua TaxID=95512 RepID=UPI002409F415|nr:synaptic vesicle glycoprotein 2B [Anastrepha obliqua]
MDNPAYIAEVENASGAHKNDKSQVYAHTMEEALDLVQVGRFHYTLMLTCGICFLTVMAEMTAVGIIMPLIKCDLAATQAEQGILASAGFFGVVFSSHIVGFLADTWGRLRILRCSLILAAIVTIISTFSVNTWMLITFRFLNGFFICGGQACVFSYIGEFHSNRTRVRHITLLAISLPLAFILSPAVALVLLPLRFDFTIIGLPFAPWRIFLLFNAFLSFLGLLGLSTLPETPKYVLVHGDHDAALVILRRIYSTNTGDNAENYPVKSIVLQTGGATLANIHSVKDALKMIWKQTTPLFYRERFLQTLNLSFCLFMIYALSQGLFMWFPTILNELIAKKGEDARMCKILGNMNLTVPEANANSNCELDYFTLQVLMMMGAVFTFIFIIFAYTIDIIGKVNLLIIWFVICCICAIVVHWLSNFAATVTALILFLAVGNCGGIIGTLTTEFYPTQINAMGMCFVMMIGRLGSVAGGNIVGLTIFNHCDGLLWGFVAITVTLIALATVLPEQKREKKVNNSAAN